MIIDVINGHLRIHNKVNHHRLRSRSARAQTRLVVFSCEDLLDIDYAALDDICFTFYIDPYCLWRILEYDYAHLENLIDDRLPTHQRKGLVQDMFPARSFWI